MASPFDPWRNTYGMPHPEDDEINPGNTAFDRALEHRRPKRRYEEILPEAVTQNSTVQALRDWMAQPGGSERGMRDAIPSLRMDPIERIAKGHSTVAGEYGEPGALSKWFNKSDAHRDLGTGLNMLANFVGPAAPKLPPRAVPQARREVPDIVEQWARDNGLNYRVRPSKGTDSTYVAVDDPLNPAIFSPRTRDEIIAKGQNPQDIPRRVTVRAADHPGSTRKPGEIDTHRGVNERGEPLSNPQALEDALGAMIPVTKDGALRLTPPGSLPQRPQPTPRPQPAEPVSEAQMRLLGSVPAATATAGLGAWLQYLEPDNGGVAEAGRPGRPRITPKAEPLRPGQRMTADEIIGAHYAGDDLRAIAADAGLDVGSVQAIIRGAGQPKTTALPDENILARISAGDSLRDIQRSLELKPRSMNEALRRLQDRGQVDRDFRVRAQATPREPSPEHAEMVADFTTRRLDWDGLAAKYGMGHQKIRQILIDEGVIAYEGGRLQRLGDHAPPVPSGRAPRETAAAKVKQVEGFLQSGLHAAEIARATGLPIERVREIADRIMPARDLAPMAATQRAASADYAAEVAWRVQRGETDIEIARDLGISRGEVRDLAEAPAGIRAYHGSPYDFDKFDISKIGTGEGVQAYGRGLYFAENEAVARHYRDALADGSPAKVAMIQRLVDRGIGHDEIGRALSMPVEHVADLAKGVPPSGPKRGRMYEVNIRARPDEFLDWEKPISMQSEHVRSALERSGIKAAEADLGEFAGSKITSAPRWADSTQDVVALRDAGIKGIRYKDQVSRQADGGTSNLVVFDDSIIEILRKYGLLPPAAMAAAGAAAEGPEPY